NAGLGGPGREGRSPRGELRLHPDGAGAKLLAAGLGRRRVLRLAANAVTPWGSGPRLELAVELEVDALVEEAQHPGDPAHLVERLVVEPDQVLLRLAAVWPDREVPRLALVRAARHRIRRLELGDDVLPREVP